MIEINEIESKYLDLMEGEISIKEFEHWVYNSKWLEDELSENEYTELISLNYNTPSSKYEIGKILKERFDEGKFEAIKMTYLLDSIIDRDGKEGESLIRMYDLYCKGYYFLEDLGLGIGLFIEVPNKYGVEYFHELTEFQKKELIDSVYPYAEKLAIELKQWILSGEIKLSGEKDEALNKWQYTDNRAEKEKASRVWKVSDIDNVTGEVRSKTNTLIDKNGDFIHKSELKENWWIKLLNKFKPNR